MFNPVPTLHPVHVPQKRRLLALVALFGLVGVTGSLGLFTDQDQVGSNSFASGTVILTPSPTSTILALSNMAPGDSTTGALVLTNSGSLGLRYAMTTSATNVDTKGLAGQLTLVVKTIGGGCATFDGTQLYSGSLAAGAIGNPQTGDQGSDRALAAGANETLCFRVTLPLGTGDAFQGAATVATFTFDSEQTKNN